MIPHFYHELNLHLNFPQPTICRRFGRLSSDYRCEHSSHMIQGLSLPIVRYICSLLNQHTNHQDVEASLFAVFNFFIQNELKSLNKISRKVSDGRRTHHRVYWRRWIQRLLGWYSAILWIVGWLSLILRHVIRLSKCSTVLRLPVACGLKFLESGTGCRLVQGLCNCL